MEARTALLDGECDVRTTASRSLNLACHAVDCFKMTLL